MKKIPYVICSSDRYSDLWPIHLHQLSRHADINQFDIYIICNLSTASLPGCTILRTGLDKSWSNMLRIGLEMVPYSSILLTLDDFLIFRSVNTLGLKSVFSMLSASKDINFVRLIPRPSGSRIYSDSYTLVQPSDKYFFSLQATVWNKKLLIHLLTGDFSPWQFETLLSNRNASNIHLCTKSDYLGYAHHSVQRGKWFPWAYFRIFVLNTNLKNHRLRPVMNAIETLAWFFHKYLSCFKSLIFN